MTTTDDNRPIPHHARALTDDVLAERRGLCGPITIKGLHAAVGGARNRFATVFYGDGRLDEVAWETIARLREKDR